MTVEDIIRYAAAVNDLVADLHYEERQCILLTALAVEITTLPPSERVAAVDDAHKDLHCAMRAAEDGMRTALARNCREK